jgi:hypothetical protein
MSRYFRGYTFYCLCGRLVTGQYPITEDEFKKVGTTDEVPLDRTKAVCKEPRGSAAGQKNSTTSLHDIGCGQTLAAVDAARLAERAAR